MDYNEVFLHAWRKFLDKYEQEKIQPLTESDIHGHLFSLCLEQLKSEGFETPYKVHMNWRVFSARKKSDIVLGDKEIVVEVKFEPDYPGVSKPVTFRELVEEDLERISNYKKRGIPHTHFVMIDEDGFHMRNPRIPHKWQTMTVRGKQAYVLHVEH